MTAEKSEQKEELENVGSAPSHAKRQAVPKGRAVPILPKQVVPAVPRTVPVPVPLAPRPVAGGVPAGQAGPANEGASGRDDETGRGARAQEGEEVRLNGEKVKRTQRTRIFTEEDDQKLIAFWSENYEQYTRSSKLSFARKAAEYMNMLFAMGGDTTSTHEKQVHNKICYLARRYDFVVAKYGCGACPEAETDGSGPLTAEVMQRADSDFPYFSRMHAFMAGGRSRKRKACAGTDCTSGCEGKKACRREEGQPGSTVESGVPGSDGGREDARRETVSDRELELKKQEILLRTRESRRQEADLKLRQRDFESRHQESLCRIEMQLVHQLRESAKTFFDIGMPANANKCMDKVASLLKLS